MNIESEPPNTLEDTNVNKSLESDGEKNDDGSFRLDEEERRKDEEKMLNLENKLNNIKNSLKEENNNFSTQIELLKVIGDICN